MATTAPPSRSDHRSTAAAERVVANRCARSTTLASLRVQITSLFAGNRERGSVNQTLIEPELSYNFESGWYIDTNPSITMDWTADSADAWTLPVGADAGKAFTLGRQEMSMQAGWYYLVERPADNPQWIIRVQLTLLFPTGR